MKTKTEKEIYYELALLLNKKLYEDNYITYKLFISTEESLLQLLKKI